MYIYVYVCTLNILLFTDIIYYFTCSMCELMFESSTFILKLY